MAIAGAIEGGAAADVVYQMVAKIFCDIPPKRGSAELPLGTGANATIMGGLAMLYAFAAYKAAHHEMIAVKASERKSVEAMDARSNAGTQISPVITLLSFTAMLAPQFMDLEEQTGVGPNTSTCMLTLLLGSEPVQRMLDQGGRNLVAGATSVAKFFRDGAAFVYQRATEAVGGAEPRALANAT